MSVTPNDTEKAILKAAEQEFMLKGYGGARTTTIAGNAGVTHAMLHYYYRTKESLYERIIEDKVAELQKQVLSLFSEDEGVAFVSKIGKVVEHHFNMLVENPLIPLFVLSELRNNPERLDGWFTKIGELVEEFAPKLQAEINCAVKEGKIRDISIHALISDIISLNISSVSFADVLSRVFGMSSEEYLEMRRKENIEVMRKRLLL